MKLRPYQIEGLKNIRAAWAQGKKVVMFRMPTGGGKTPVFCQVLKDEQGHSLMIAHRTNLIAQASLTLARNGVVHRVIGSGTLQKICTRLHMRKLKKSFIDPSARCAVASVNSIAAMKPDDPFLRQVKQWVVDEGHHLLAKNVWGRAIANCPPDARGLAPTATPGRPDGKGLGRHADGLADIMVPGPEMWELMDWGYLTPYHIYAPPSDLDVSDVRIGESGEFNPEELAKAYRKSTRIVGDVVRHYQELTPGKLGMTFAVNVEEATKILHAFRAAGVPAEMITGDTDPDVRDRIMERFESRKVLQLVSVDILGEGTDVPAVEVISMARHTNSNITFSQQLGRLLRLLVGDQFAAHWDEYTNEQRRAIIAASDKPFGVLIDHVGNVFRHGLPESPRPWTLDRREKTPRGAPVDVIPLTTCLREEPVPCGLVYERIHPACPHCGFEPVPAVRSAPNYVDGDLRWVDREWLNAGLREKGRIDGPPPNLYGMDAAAQGGAIKNHRGRQQAQKELRHRMELLAGWYTAAGKSMPEIQRRFFHRYSVDVLSAQCLNAEDAYTLSARINDDLFRMSEGRGVIDGRGQNAA